MSFKSGDYIVFTEEKKEKVLNNFKNIKTRNIVYESHIKKLNKSKRDKIYIFIEYTTSSEEKFSANINGIVMKELQISDFRLATMKEKIRYDLSQIYNK